MKQKRVWRFSSVLIIGLTLFLLGLALPKLLTPIDPSWGWAALPILLFGLLARKRKSWPLYAALIVVLFLLGWVRGSVYFSKVAAYEELYYETVQMEATSLEDANYGKTGQLTFSADNIVVKSPMQVSLVGQVEISGFGANAVYRGDRVYVEGKMFPKRGANQAGISFAEVQVLSRSSSPINELRRRFAAGMQDALPEPLASFALGLLIGQRSTLSPEITQELIAVGLIHVVAVSGYNLTIITHASQKLFSKRSRYQSFVFSLAIIILFLLLTGNSPSIVRAAIVSIIGLIAWYFGRKMRPMLLLLVAAAITAGNNPLFLWSNIGWYLSFSAFFGVLVLAPLLQKRFIKKSLSEKLLPAVLVETTAAQLCTLPIILLTFGRLSPVSILANVLVVPFVPFAMLFSLFAGIGGMINFALTGLVAFPARLVLEYMLSVAGWLSDMPFANLELQIDVFQTIYLYILIAFMIIVLQRQVNKRRATISQENKE